MSKQNPAYQPYETYDLFGTPISISIGDFEVPKLLSLSLKNSMQQFVDTIEMTFANPFNCMGKVVKLGDPITAIYRSETYQSAPQAFGVITLLEGILEYYNSSKTSESQLTLAGRHKILNFTEQDFSPPRQFKDTTDNAIITEALKGWDGEFNLDPPVQIKQEDATPGTSRAALAERAANATGHHLYVVGRTVFKKKTTKKAGDSQYTLYESYDPEKNNVLDVQPSIDISRARKKISGYQSAVSGSSQRKIQQTTDTDLEIKTFKNKYTINRDLEVSVELPAKDNTQAELVLEREKAKVEPSEKIKIWVQNWILFDLNSVIHLESEFHGISGEFVVFERIFSLTKEGSIVTEITVVPLGRDFIDTN